ncbi:hypothetical protein BEWA_022820 [Theileria equi strain WA]|uniref:C2 domain-containing protein n=1 Tax=Theileria equi strain WA TaxID=1537102 RepID=L0AX31_THEEQ|nr:hypothetical protein BEWA_022820 [Theileria equi strain WA]AFZ79434.1 hypothetical protein BEWA_022820 [Theileria equi strain WA]|eukprot:XP_004829100.1 hypothetical protein BEWA_022820 [Theileria equi strain WA]
MLTSIGVFGPGDNVPLFKENDGPSGQALAADGSSSLKKQFNTPELRVKYYMLYFNIVCGRDFIAHASMLSSSIAPYVKICHFGMEEQTRIIKDTPDPEWQTTIYVPCMSPSFDELVTIEIWNGETGGILLHVESIDLLHLFNNEYAPRWINIYCRPTASDVLNIVKSYVVGSVGELTDYGGRILISASATQVQTPSIKGIRPCRSTVVPPIQQRRIWIDLYEIVALSDTPNIIQVVISHGPYLVKTGKLVFNQHGSYKINDKNGRLEPLEPVVSSNDDSDMWDIFVYVYDVSDWASNNSERIAWKRIPYERVKTLDGKPMWVLLSSCTDHKLDTFNMLISFDVAANINTAVRKERLEYSLTKYIFRTMLYEALHLPCTDFDNFLNCSVEIELGGYTVKSKIVRGTIHPSFYEAKEMQVLLPTNLVLAPCIIINVFSESNSIFGSKELLCTGQYSLTKVPEEWKEAPKWIKLKSTNNPLHTPRILLAFELILHEKYRADPGKYPFFDDIVPSTVPSLISLLLIGIRTFKPLNNPRVSIRCGTSTKLSNRPFESKPVTGCYGNWNYLSIHEIIANLPKRMQHHCYLEFSIMGDTISGSNTCFGITYVALNSFLPWLTSDERNTSWKVFKMQVLEDFLATGEHAEKPEFQDKKVMSDIAAMNTKVLDKIDFVSVQRAGEAALPVDSDEEDAFEIHIPEEDAVVAERDELPYEMECDFASEDLPYMKAPIVRCTSAGVPEIVGTLKFICTVHEGVNDDIKRDLNIKMKEHRNKLIELYKKSKELVVRVYALQAKGLFTASGSADISTYLWLRNVDDENHNPGYYHNSLRDKEGSRVGLKPTYNRCYNMGCALPENAILKLSVVSMGALADEIIGTTFVDCEDRFFIDNLQKLMENDATPIELRTLKSENSTISHGTLKCWIELMDIQTAKTRPAKSLETLEPGNYEIRIVIWGANLFSMNERSTVSLCVCGVYQAEHQEIRKSTDIHHHSKDGSAVFNWRLKYDVALPTEYSTIKLQLCSSGLLSSNELIGEAIIDLAQDFQIVRRKKNPHTIARSVVSVYHVSHGNQQRGSIDMQISIISASQTKEYPAGEGRSEPNMNPFLPPVLENRTYVDWDQVKQTLDSAGGAILSGLKITGLFIAFAAFFALFLLIMIIIK